MRSVRAVVTVLPNAHISVAGLPLLARTILTLWTSGITRFTLVGGTDKPEDGHRESLRAIARAAPDVRLTWIAAHTADPHEGSTTKVLMASTSGIYRTSVVADLAKSRPANSRLIFHGQRANDLWLLTSESYDRFARGEDIAAECTNMRANDYYAVADEAAVDQAERVLFSWCIKDTDGVVSRRFNRPISTWISRHLSHTSIRPSQLTAVTALCALAMFTALVSGSPLWVGIGCILYHVTSVIDGLDGEIARAKYMSTPRGAALDTAIDMASNLLFMLGISIANEQNAGEIYAWLGGYVALTAVLAMMAMALALRFGPGGGSFDVLQLTIQQRLADSPRLNRWFVRINAAFKRDLFALLFAVIGACGYEDVIPWILAFGTTTWLISVLANVPSMLRANRDHILPPHLIRASDLSGTGDYAGSPR